ncbi:MAG: hemolysin [gamma proteobacterium symbiont of Ctena orbiculata]|uniref:Hemolysin family protein n=1 Tax=Candidatus Thiodiazotropha taylori TaxID=2792791 RepID=A0A944MBU9_9GAMM|nr:hemolysin family protein [Candidatus Thiodiazotropha taylori]PUB85747.1 MAG: hemolysin [gamma proteobacterium symbiont of Ctena orbiculata]MBT2988185.1 hemolysin family protein [Candidatus Thiodiazotropha taylori]MBT2996082.1 hemolysin family protein [Candidatus Thiodiazotropha taylori]MBT2999774.1 hemolysin family protein [Candidatus Thiodiazotropha taylori]
MLLLTIYVLIALGFSFLCSIAEAVILSVTHPYISVLDQEGNRAAPILREMKREINDPLAAILTLNTTAHTIGAAGAGAQAAVVFGSGYVGVASGVLTFMILVFSEIIPKTLGANYWRQLAPVTAYTLKFLIWILYPFVVMSAMLTRLLSRGKAHGQFRRDEFTAMAEAGIEEGKLDQHESLILKNLFLLRDTRVTDVMTPRTVVFSLDENVLVKDYIEKHNSSRFSRIPVYDKDRDHVTGFVLRSDLLISHARGNSENSLDVYRREMPAIPDTSSLQVAFELFIEKHSHIMLVVDEYGSMEGILTLEDILETILGIEIVDEGDRIDDMRKLARRLWKKRANRMGLEVDEWDE